MTEAQYRAGWSGPVCRHCGEPIERRAIFVTVDGRRPLRWALVDRLAPLYCPSDPRQGYHLPEETR